MELEYWRYDSYDPWRYMWVSGRLEIYQSAQINFDNNKIGAVRIEFRPWNKIEFCLHKLFCGENWKFSNLIEIHFKV